VGKAFGNWNCAEYILHGYVKTKAALKLVNTLAMEIRMQYLSIK
jgi:hypothetical protein